MNVSGSLQLTQKGEDELKRRVYKLGMKKRSLLILLEKPQTIEHVLKRTVLPADEFEAEVHSLVSEGFLVADVALDASPSRGPASVASPAAQPSSTDFYIDEDIILSEAKFLLTDFCVDSFGTGSQVFVDEIRACSKTQEFGSCFARALAEAKKRCPERVPTLLALVKEINDTAA
jgi:hypothetical protein